MSFSEKLDIKPGKRSQLSVKGVFGGLITQVRLFANLAKIITNLLVTA